MRYLYSFFLLFFTSSVFANTYHLAPLINYNVEQDSGTGYGLALGYTLFEGIEAEAIYIHSNQISYQDNDTTLTGKFNNILLGINATKAYNNDLSFKLGGGIGYTFSSDNEYLVKDKKLNPYMKFALNYRIYENTSFELGQITQKIDGDLSVSHSFFASLSWKFGHNSFTAQPTLKQTPPRAHFAKINKQTPTPEVTTTSQTKNTISTKPTMPEDTPWYVQLGAYKSNKLALKALLNYQKQIPNLTLSIKSDSSLHKIVTTGHADKASAVNLKEKLQAKYAIPSYVIFLP